jgi:phosphohistidine phosphatase SixA
MHRSINAWRIACAIVWTIAVAELAQPARADEAAAWRALSGGPAIVLFRHAQAPGGGDPPGFKLGDCATQRNLDEAGRAQARRIGEAFRARKIEVGQVLTSQWCRSAQTAELAFPGRATPEPAFNSVFNAPEREAPQTAAARKVLLAWRGPGALVVTSHHANIIALTGIAPASGEGVVIKPSGDGLAIVGRIRP